MSTSLHSTADLLKLLRDLGAMGAEKPMRLMLEPRVVFDGAGIALAADMVATTADAAQASVADASAPASDHAALVHALQSGAPPAPAASIVFIDSAVSDPQVIASAVQPGAEIVMIDHTSDGLQQMAHYLAGRSGIGAIHIVSHGDTGMLELGSTIMTQSTLASHAGDLAVIKSALAEDADILIYGCDVAAGSAGHAFIDTLAANTGADIAASTNDTGGATKGGDWVLEAQTGTIDTSAITATGWTETLNLAVANVAVSGASVSGPAVTALAQQILGDGVIINSATYSGGGLQAATFVTGAGLSFGSNVLNFSDGAIFSSGTAASVAGPNTQAGYTVDAPGIDGDAQFNALAGNATYDASFIVINFTPDVPPGATAGSTGRMTIQIVFGSDEYNEYVYGGVNDTMAIIVNGQNKAIVPNGLAIGIDTINNAATYNPGAGAVALDPNPEHVAAGFESANPTLYITNHTATYNTQMDGFTITLPVTFDVIVGQANTIKIGIADSGDAAWDSWLFVKADSGQTVIVAENDSISTDWNTPKAIQVTANDYDLQGDILSITHLNDKPVAPGDVVTLASGVTVTVGTGGNLTVTGNGSSIANDAFTYQISDGNGGSSIAFVDVEITKPNAAPTLDLDSNNSSGAAGIGFITTFVENGSGVAIADADLSIVDDGNLMQASILLTNAQPGDTLNAPASLPAGISIDPASTSTHIVLTGSASPAAYATAIKAITFANSSDAPDGTTVRTVNVQITDDHSQASTVAVASIHVTPVNDAPTGADTIITTAEDAAVTLTAAAFGFSDPSDEAANSLQAVKIGSLPASGALAFNGTPITAAQIAAGFSVSATDIASGKLTWTPAANANGSGLASFTFQVQDNGGTANGGIALDPTPNTITFDVTPVNDAPVASNDFASGTAHLSITVAVLDNDGDIDGTLDPAAVQINGTANPGDSFIVPGEGTWAINVTTGAITFTALPTFNGAPTPITYTVADNSGERSAAATISIMPLINEPHLDLSGQTPKVGAITYPHNGGYGATAAWASPAGLDRFTTVSAETSGPGLTLTNDGSSGQITGVASATLAESIAEGEYVSMSLTTKGSIPETWLQETALRIAGGQFKFAFAISADGFKSATLLSNDNTANAFTGNIYDANPNYSLAAATDYQLQPNTTYELRAYIYAMPGGAAATGTWDDLYIVYSNDPISNVTTFTEGGAAVAIATTTAEIEDTDNASMASGIVTLTNKQASDQLLVSGVIVANGATGTINGIGYTVDDTAGSTTITLSGSATKAAYATALAAITFQNTSDTPNTSDRLINVSVNDGTRDSNLATTTIHVVPVNDAPAGADTIVTTLEDIAYALKTADFSFSDGEGDSLLAVKISSPPSSGTLAYNSTLITAAQIAAGFSVSAADIASGKLTWSPAANAAGSGLTNFTFQVQDSGGTANGGVDLATTPNTISFDVTAVNDAPLATTTAATALEDATSIELALAGTDVDGAISTVTVTALPTAVQGVLYLADGTTPVVEGAALTVAQAAALKFVPTANFNGTVTIPFTVMDDGGLASASAEAVITVTAVNDAPLATATTATGLEDATSIQLTLAGTDVDGAVSTVTVTALPTAVQGVLYLADGTTPVVEGAALTVAQAAALKFVATANFNGTVTVPFTVTDNDGLASTSADTVITVTAVNDAPVGTAMSLLINDNQTVSFTAVDFGLTDGNDSPANTLASVIITSLPAVGTLTLAGVAVAAGDEIPAGSLGSLEFTPAPGSGAPSFTFQVRDNGGTANGGANLDLSAKTFTINVSDVTPPLAPVATTVANPDGTLTTSGTGEPGSTVTVTYPDGSTKSVLVPANSTFSLTSALPQTSGDVVTTQMDAANLVSPDDTDAYVDVTAPLAPVASTVANPDGTLTTSGTGEPGSTVTVTYPDGSTKSVLVPANGTFSLTSALPQTSGDVVTTQQDAANLVSPVDTDAYVDVTAPLAPVASTVANPDGTLTTSGTGEPGATVTVTYPDGSTKSVLVPASGTFSLTSALPQTSGDVVTKQMDAAILVSPADTDAYVDVTAPLAPVASTVANPDGTLTTSGTGEPGSTITVTFPDGSAKSVLVPANGTFSLTSALPQTSGDVVTTQQDAANLVSPADTDAYVDVTAPLAPTQIVSQNPTGTITVVGMGEPGSIATVTYPDGTTGTVLVQPDGTYTVTSPMPQTTGTVTTSQMDLAGNVSPIVASTFIDRSQTAMMFDAPDKSLTPKLIKASKQNTVGDNTQYGTTISNEILNESKRITNLWQAEEGGRVDSRSAGNYGTMLSASLQFSSLDGPFQQGNEVAIRAETFMKNGLLTVLLEQYKHSSDSYVVDYSVTQVDGRALPQWLERLSKDVLQGRWSPNQEAIDIKIRATLSDGRVIVKEMRIDLKTGEIKALANKRSEHAPMFNEQVRKFASFNDASVAVLSDALAEAGFTPK